MLSERPPPRRVDKATSNEADQDIAFEETLVQSSASDPRGTGSDASIGRRTAEVALTKEELARTRFFLRFALVMGVGAIGPLPFLGGDPMAKRIAGGLAILALVVSARLLRALRDPARSTEGQKLLVGIVCLLAALAGAYFWGIFSLAALILVFGLSFFSSQSSFRATLALYLLCAGGYALVCALVYTGGLVDRGIYRAAPVALGSFVTLQVLAQVVFVASFLLGRANLATTIAVMVELEQKARIAARREAWLNEARQDLARALRIGEAGPYTEQTLGSFKLGVVLGRGGMGEVYEAIHVRTGEAAAVKMLHRHLLGDAAHKARFYREARAIASLASDNVVRMIEVSDDDAPVPFLAMERLVGSDLAERLRDTPRLTVAATVDLVRQVARGIGAAHAKGIVHRDLKPQNLFHVDREGDRGVWKVLDFGLSKLVDQTMTLTRGLVIGTPAYMSPEQAGGRDTDVRTDVYALAAIAYRALTGEPPFNGSDAVATVLDVATKMPPRPRALSKEIPEAVESVLLIGLAKDPRDRFASARELADALTMAASVAASADEATRVRAAALLQKQPWATTG